MPKIELKISPFFVQTLVDVMERVTKTLENEIVVPIEDIEEDADLAAAWKEGLLESLQDDCTFLLSIVSDNTFGQGIISIDADKAESTLRACSAIRLKIQQTFLQEISDKALESGNIDFHALKPDTQKVFACYVFLASWQEMLLEELYPNIGKEIGPEDP